MSKLNRNTREQSSGLKRDPKTGARSKWTGYSKGDGEREIDREIFRKNFDKINWGKK